MAKWLLGAIVHCLSESRLLKYKKKNTLYNQVLFFSNDFSCTPESYMIIVRSQEEVFTSTVYSCGFEICIPFRVVICYVDASEIEVHSSLAHVRWAQNEEMKTTTIYIWCICYLPPYWFNDFIKLFVYCNCLALTPYTFFYNW